MCNQVITIALRVVRRFCNCVICMYYVVCIYICIIDARPLIKLKISMEKKEDIARKLMKVKSSGFPVVL